MTRKSELIQVAMIGIVSAAALIFWLPNDVETGLVHTHRRQTLIGDMLIPAISVSGILALAIIQFAITLFSKPKTSLGADLPDADLTDDDALFFFRAKVLAILIAGCVLMYWAGPLAVSLLYLNEDGSSETYRNLRGTMPWNLIGYFLGSMTILVGLSVAIEGKFKPIRLVSSLIAVLALIFIFQGPIDNLLLPPNGDW